MSTTLRTVKEISKDWSKDNRSEKISTSEIRELIDDIDNLTFGYIGNCGRSGDFRSYRIWVDNVRSDDGLNNKQEIWSSGNNNYVTYSDYLKIRGILRIFKIGFASATNG